MVIKPSEEDTNKDKVARVYIPDSMKEDLKFLGNCALCAICPPAFAAKGGIMSSKNTDWYTKTKSAIKRGTITGIACLALSFLGDELVTSSSTTYPSEQVSITNGKLDYSKVRGIGIEDSTIIGRSLFPLVRFASPSTYRSRELDGIFSGEFHKDGLEFKISGRFPKEKNFIEVTFEDLNNYTSYISVDKKKTLDYLSK